MSLAIRTASASSSKGTTDSTGPKISSVNAAVAVAAGVSTVGGNQKPGPCGHVALEVRGVPVDEAAHPVHGARR